MVYIENNYPFKKTPPAIGEEFFHSLPKVLPPLSCLSGGIAGAGGGGRTRTVLPPTDFESVTSANSITPANITNHIITYRRDKVKGITQKKPL